MINLNKYKINASLTCINLCNIKDSMQEINNSSISNLHYDVVDGRFNNCFMFGDRMLPVFKSLTYKPIIVHLACEEPTLYIPTFIKNKADGIIIHYESKCDVLSNLKIIKQAGLQAILGFCCNTDVPDDFLTYANEADSILKLTVFPGFSGQKFYKPALEHIKEMKKRMDKENISIPIEVDGNINRNTILSCAMAGATLFTGGTSGLFNKNHTLQENLSILYKTLENGVNDDVHHYE